MLFRLFIIFINITLIFIMYSNGIISFILMFIMCSNGIISFILKYS